MNLHVLSDDAIITEYLDYKEYLPNVKNYQYCLLNGFKNYLNSQGATFRTMGSKNVKAYHKMKQANKDWKSPKSVHTFLVIVKSFCLWLRDKLDVVMIGKRGDDLDMILIEKSRLKEIIDMRLPRVPQRITAVPPVTLPELRKIFNAMIRNKTDGRNFAFKRMWVLCYFGCRVKEISRIEPHMLDMDNNKIKLDTAKTEVERIVFYDDFTKPIFEEYIEDNKLLNVVPAAWWHCVKQYGTVLGKKIETKLGRQAFNSNMDNLDFWYSEGGMKTHAKLDNNFAKVISGHSITGLKDITAVYRKYPEDLIKAAMTKHHYLLPLEDELKKMLYWE